MKIRSDFVSNSSSTSYVIACKMQYLDAVLKDLSRACTNKHDSYHNKGLAKRNQGILDFCVKTFELVYLGDLVVDTKDEVYSLKYFKKLHCKKDFAVKEWESYKAKVTGKVALNPWDEIKDDEYDQETDTIVHHEKTYARDVVVARSVMESHFKRYQYDNTPDPQDVVDFRVKEIVKLAKAVAASENSPNAADPYLAIGQIDIYQITQETIDNTREILDHGYEIEFDEWEDLDRLEAKIKSGDALFVVTITHGGDGYGEFYIYCEDGADGLSGISGIEVVSAKSL